MHYLTSVAACICTFCSNIRIPVINKELYDDVRVMFSFRLLSPPRRVCFSWRLLPTVLPVSKHHSPSFRYFIFTQGRFFFGLSPSRGDSLHRSTQYLTRRREPMVSFAVPNFLLVGAGTWDLGPKQRKFCILTIFRLVGATPLGDICEMSIV